MNSILDHMMADFPLGENDLKLLQSKIKTKQVAKGEILLMKGELSNDFYFVKSGLLRSYVIDDNGKEHIFMFAPEGWIIADNVSNAIQAPSELFIDALEASVIEVCNKHFFEEAMAQHSQVGATGTKKLINRMAVLQKRVIMLMSASAMQRYEHFLETYPNIVQRVTQKMIASYLGITPEALSKIRGGMARKK